MDRRRIVIDTNVFVAALRSRRGPSFRLLSMVGGDKFDICLSTPLLFEYEDVLACEVLSISKSAADDILNYLCQIAVAQEIYYLWHPCLPNPKDDLVLELAVASQGPQILTCNVKNFASSERFNVRAVRPSEFLTEFGEKS